MGYLLFFLEDHLNSSICVAVLLQLFELADCPALVFCLLCGSMSNSTLYLLLLFQGCFSFLSLFCLLFLFCVCVCVCVGGGQGVCVSILEQPHHVDKCHWDKTLDNLSSAWLFVAEKLHVSQKLTCGVVFLMLG